MPELQWIKGSDNVLADALSRRRHNQEVGIQVNVLDVDDLPLAFLQKLRNSLCEDEELQKIITSLDRGKERLSNPHDIPSMRASYGTKGIA